MKNKKHFKKKNVNYRKDQDEIRIKERKKLPKKLNKQHIYAMMEDDEDTININLYRDNDDF